MKGCDWIAKRVRVETIQGTQTANISEKKARVPKKDCGIKRGRKKLK